MSEEKSDENVLIISLLGRIAFTNDELKKLVQKGGKKQEKMLQVYNFCDGKTSLTEIAKKSTVTKQAVSFSIDKWAELGIILKKIKGGGKFCLVSYLPLSRCILWKKNY